MDAADIKRRFTYHAPDDHDVRVHEAVRQACRNLAELLNNALPEGREKSLAITHLEDTMMWSNASIARDPLPRSG